MYLGRNPAVGTQKMLDSLELQFNGTLTTFDLRYGGVPIYPTLSESLIVSLGGVLQEPGEAFYVSSDRIVFSEAPPAGAECWILLYSQYGASAGSSSSSPVIQATGEPMGFENRTHSTISFNNGTRTFSIAPNTAGGYSSYVIWTKGVKRIVSATQSVQIGTSTGLYYIYFDAFGDLQYKTTYFTWDTETPVAYVYLNASSLPSAVAPFIADERHGVVLDWQTHEYLHRTRGAVIAEGFSISNYTTTGNGNADAHAQFDLGNGTFFDEDLEVNITHSASPTVGTFTQVLTGGAEIPVFYMKGPAGAWLRDSATKYACMQSGTTLQYNSLSAGIWSTTAADNNRYVVSWIVATNDINAPVICILGQSQYTDIGSAEAVKFGNLTLTNFPIIEFRPLWKVIFQTSTGFTNAPNALIANVLDLRQLSETGEAGTVVSDHGLLSGLVDDDHSQYIHTTLTRTGVTAEFNTTGKITTTDNIGVGTASPSVRLDVWNGQATISARTKANTGTTLRLSTTDTSNKMELLFDHSTNNYWRIQAVEQDVGYRPLILQNDGGNVGIGTINPLTKLDVNGQISTRVGSSISYLAGETYQIWNDNPEYFVLDAPSAWRTMKTFVVSKTGTIRFKFSGYIEPGTYYWAWRIINQNSTRVASGHYNSGLDAGQSASTHEYRRFVADVSDVTPGDTLYLQMISANSSGEALFGVTAPAPSGGQKLYAKEFRAYSTTPSIDHGGSNNIWGNFVGIGTINPITKLDVNGTIRGERYAGINSLVLNSYQTVNPSSNVFLYSPGNDRDSWIYLDSADTISNWGIYHRQIDSAVLELPANSIGFIGGGTSTAQAYISLQTGNACFKGNVGVGTTNVLNRLNVYSALDDGGLTLEIGRIPAGDEGPALTFRHNTNNGTSRVFAKIKSSMRSGNDTSWGSDLSFYTGGHALTEHLTINNIGDVGIGTTNPEQPLTIYRNIDSGSQVRQWNASSGSNAFVAYRLSSNAANSVWWWLNSSTRTVDGGVNTSTIRNDAGDMRIQALGEVGLHIKATTGNIGIGTGDPSYKLEVVGSFAATTKSFIIPHPTKEGYKLRHGSLEGPENGVYIRGQNNSGIINLPEYWTGLIDPESITVNLTAIGQNAPLWVERIEDNTVYIGREDTSVSYFYTVFAERIDVPALDVEIKIKDEDE